MIRVVRPPATRCFAASHRRRLRQRQDEANGLARHDPGNNRAWSNFRRSTTGRAVYAALQDVFHSKCAFCERVNARTADHFYPRATYPKRMFRWPNLLLCCGECNPVKGDYFPFLNGRPVLIDPTREDPLDFFTWDLTTGAMEAVAGAVAGHRARETRDRLRLEEGPLRDERKAQLLRVLYLLARVAEERPHVRADTRRQLELELSPSRPYLGIIRFLFRAPNRYRPIVERARARLPEIDAWTAAWL